MADKAESETAPRERAEAQRCRILDAAQACFIRHGFDAASMAEIAAAARMSPGLIYRYFSSKNAIILGIIERQLEEARADIASLRSGADLLPRIAGLFEQWRRGDPGAMNPVLYLDTVAHSSRDKRVACALDESERIREEAFARWFRDAIREESRGEPDDDEVRTRILLLKCFIEGLIVRAVRDPELDPARLLKALELFLPQLLMIDEGRDPG